MYCCLAEQWQNYLATIDVWFTARNILNTSSCSTSRNVIVVVLYLNTTIIGYFRKKKTGKYKITLREVEKCIYNLIFENRNNRYIIYYVSLECKGTRGYNINLMYWSEYVHSSESATLTMYTDFSIITTGTAAMFSLNMNFQVVDSCL